MNEYKTTDFCLTAYLLCEGFEIERYYNNPSKPEQLIFVFKEDWSLKRAVNDFMTRKAKVEPLTFLFNLKRVKLIIWQNKNKSVSKLWKTNQKPY
jgi:hypothetical protein